LRAAGPRGDFSFQRPGRAADRVLCFSLSAARDRALNTRSTGGRRAMPRPNRRNSRLVLLTLVLAVAPACGSSAGGVRGDGRGLAARLSDRFAYRPVYPAPNPLPRTRALFLSGYAGARYGPAAASAPVYPTTYQAVNDPCLAFWRYRP
jgi:hypothetical protein